MVEPFFVTVCLCIFLRGARSAQHTTPATSVRGVCGGRVCRGTRQRRTEIACGRMRRRVSLHAAACAAPPAAARQQQRCAGMRCCARRAAARRRLRWREPCGVGHAGLCSARSLLQAKHEGACSCERQQHRQQQRRGVQQQHGARALQASQEAALRETRGVRFVRQMQSLLTCNGCVQRKPRAAAYTRLLLSPPKAQAALAAAAEEPRVSALRTRDPR